jgi:hypothetical protein
MPRGERYPQNDKVRELAEALGVDPEDIHEGPYGILDRKKGTEYYNGTSGDAGSDNSNDTIDLGAGGRVSRQSWREFEQKEAESQQRGEDLSRQWPE